MSEMLPACEDALDIALEESTVSNRVAARQACVLPEEVRFGEVLANGADRRKPKVNTILPQRLECLLMISVRL